MIIYNDEKYTLNKFASFHYKSTRPDRSSACNAWFECEYEVNNGWVSTHDIKN